MWLLSTWLAKIIYRVITFLGVGNGTTLPGHLLLKIFPKLPNKINFNKGIILISGTNGKTTTSKIITHFLESLDIRVTHNKSGSNLMRGIVSASLLDTRFFGKPLGDVGVFEVDEFHLPSAIKLLSPAVVVLLNLSRDQLDRYGEIDIIFDRWTTSIKELSTKSTIICDCAQPEFRQLPGLFEGSVLYFDDNSDLLSKTNLHGNFNAKNLNAASLALESLGYTKSQLEAFLPKISVAYGRGEKIEFNCKNYYLFLAKNPASFNHNLDMLLNEGVVPNTIIFVLNDNIPDGRDVSWIYDIEPEKLNSLCFGKTIHVSGKRAFDMAVRLKYAGVTIQESNINRNLKETLTSISTTEALVLPNYSAMLETRKILTGKKIL